MVFDGTELIGIPLPEKCVTNF